MVWSLSCILDHHLFYCNDYSLIFGSGYSKWSLYAFFLFLDE
jgi:hypothetical protein